MGYEIGLLMRKDVCASAATGAYVDHVVTISKREIVDVTWGGIQA